MVACDEGSNALAGRMWWLMRYFGQPAALLDGGLAAWKAAGLPLETGPVESQPVPIAGLQAITTMGGYPLNKCWKTWNRRTMLSWMPALRSAFPVKMKHWIQKAAAFPDSVNRHMELNLASNGKFKDPATLRSEFESLLGDTAAAAIVHSCGSGVTACHNLFAMELAGMDTGRLYPGSWSEWIRDPSRPIETGN